MADSNEERWLKALMATAPEGPGRLDPETVAAAAERTQRRRVLGAAVIVTSVVVAGVGFLMPHARSTARVAGEVHYAAVASARNSNAEEEATARAAKPKSRRASTHTQPRVLHVDAPPLAGPPDEDVESAVVRDEPRARRRPAVAKPKTEPELEPSVEALMAAAKAARSRQDAPAARRALIQVRELSPGSLHAGRATFLLGRVELELAGDRQKAMRWFERYIEEFSSGHLASQARGRLLNEMAKAKDPKTAAAAEDYLRHHPKGGYADLARRLRTPDPVE